jgi:hypothetical protein
MGRNSLEGKVGDTLYMKLQIIADPMIGTVLEQVAKNRMIRFGDLLQMTDPPTAREAARGAIRKLRAMRLIDENESAIEDFNTLYITADGLSAIRKLETSGSGQ